MVTRRPLVNVSGQTTELPPGDTLTGGSIGILVAGSGLDGGGNLSETVTPNVVLAPNPSGLLFAGGKLGVDGAVQTASDTALASGNAALVLGAQALASGIAGSTLAATALASGNAALTKVATTPGGTVETFTAASAIASGYAVGLDDAGKVQSVNSFTDVNSLSFGTSAVFESATTSYVAVTYDSSNNVVVFAYRDQGNSNYGTAVVGTVSGNSISYGTPVVFTSASCEYVDITYDSINNRVVVCYSNATSVNRSEAKVGTVSGTSISFGSATIISANICYLTRCTFNVSTGAVIVAYTNGSSSLIGQANAGFVSGTTISFGTPYTFNSGSTTELDLAYNAQQGKVVIAYRDAGNSSYGTAIVASNSGTTITYGSEVVFESATTSYPFIAHATSSKMVVAYQDQGNSSYGTAVVGTVSGTSISFGTPVVFESATTNWIAVSYDSANDKVLLSYNESAVNAKARVGTITGTSISFGTASVFEAANPAYVDSAYDSSNNRLVVGYRAPSTLYGTAIVGGPATAIEPTVSSQNNFIGIAQSTVASGSPVQVRLPGSYDQNNTGLSAGALYYVDPTTSGFTTSASQPAAWSGAVSWGPVGRAVNSTTLLLTDTL